MTLLNKLKNNVTLKIFAVFLNIQFLAWIIIPLLRPNIPMDSVEAIVWGSEWSFGTNKHPFLGGWLAQLSYLLCQNPDVSVYMLSQVCVLLGFIYIYKIAKLFLTPDKALLSTMFLEGTIYYSICSVEYNVNVLSLALVPMLVYYFYRALTTHKFLPWILTGVLMAAVLMTKYTNGLFLIAMGLYLVATREGRIHFKKPGMYLAGAVCLMLCLPHIIWLVENDFYPFVYLLARASQEAPSFAVRHFVWPLKFAFAQILAMSLTLIGFAIFFMAAHKTTSVKFKKPPLFVLFMGLLPFFLWVIISFLGGVKLKSMWGFAFVFMIPTIVFYVFDFKVTEKSKKLGVLLAYLMLFVMVLCAVGTTFCHTSTRANFPGREFAHDMKTIWSNEMQAPLKYTGGDIWFTSLLYVYLPEAPRVLIQMNPQAAPWIDVEDVKRQGAIVMADNMEEYTAFQNRVEGVPDPVLVPYRVKSLFGKEKTVMIHYGILKPLKEDK